MILVLATVLVIVTTLSPLLNSSTKWGKKKPWRWNLKTTYVTWSRTFNGTQWKKKHQAKERREKNVNGKRITFNVNGLFKKNERSFSSASENNRTYHIKSNITAYFICDRLSDTFGQYVSMCSFHCRFEHFSNIITSIHRLKNLLIEVYKKLENLYVPSS